MFFHGHAVLHDELKAEQAITVAKLESQGRRMVLPSGMWTYVICAFAGMDLISSYTMSAVWVWHTKE